MCRDSYSAVPRNVSTVLECLNMPKDVYESPRGVLNDSRQFVSL